MNFVIFMVRVNIINPRMLADQHLIAEYLEIMMLVGHVKKHENINYIPEKYKLGTGHINFFKNKLKYLKERHELIKNEMRKRNFKARKTINFKGIDKKLINNWKPQKNDFKVIINRIICKISQKPKWYRYYGEKKDVEFYKKLISID